MSDFSKITLFGSGKLATQLGKALKNSGIEIEQVWSRNLENAKALSKELNSKPINKLSQVKPTQLGIIAISDDAIKQFIQKLPEEIPVAHCSGNTSLIERANGGLTGVFYPLQTFTNDNKINWKEVPICVESEDDHFLKLIFSLAEKLTPTVKIINSDQRKILHTSAVFACNFTNHMTAIAEHILDEKKIEFDLILPLIKQTFKNISEGNIKSKQTGPALREDYATIDSHMNALTENPDLKELYLAVSKHIIEFHHGTEL